MKEKVIKFLNFLFPAGNFRYYVMYLSSLLVLAIALLVIVIMMGLMVNGDTVATDGFVAHITSSFPPRSDFAMMVINNLYNLFGCLWLIMAIHTGLSIVADFAVRPLLWLYRTILSFTSWYPRY